MSDGKPMLVERSTAAPSVSSRPIPRASQTPPAVVVICPDDARRRTLVQTFEAQHVTVLNELGYYPARNRVASVAGLECDAFVVEIDSVQEAAFALIEAICGLKPSATVMAYSSKHSQELVINAMRAGAREFLTGTIPPGVMAEALHRAITRSAETLSRRLGKLFLFWSAKGGAGVSTVATNFAVALRQETGSKVALLDLNPLIGDAAVLLGLKPRFTIADAFRSPARLDREFLSTLITEHNSGVSVIAAPDAYDASLTPDADTVGALVDLLRYEFPYLVVDVGQGLAQAVEPLLQIAAGVYVLAQLDIPTLRNTERFISYLRKFAEGRVELVLNRFNSRGMDFDQERVQKALGMAPSWKIPNDYAAVGRASNMGAPVMGERSPVAAVLRQMARVACGKPADAKAQKTSRIFGL